jgi:hypothetical protein
LNENSELATAVRELAAKRGLSNQLQQLESGVEKATEAVEVAKEVKESVDMLERGEIDRFQRFLNEHSELATAVRELAAKRGLSDQLQQLESGVLEKATQAVESAEEVKESEEDTLEPGEIEGFQRFLKEDPESANVPPKWRRIQQQQYTAEAAMMEEMRHAIDEARRQRSGALVELADKHGGKVMNGALRVATELLSVCGAKKAASCFQERQNQSVLTDKFFYNLC